MRETKLKSSKGITLIALVITIIVLLILAGVAISLLSGDNGILKQAANAKTEQEAAQKREETALTDMEVITDFKTSGKNIKYKFKNGYLTNVTPGEVIGDIKDKLPTGYTLVGNDDEIVKTGTEIKKGTQTVGRVVIFGDIDGDGLIKNQDSTRIGVACTTKEELENFKEYQVVAMDINNDKIINWDDSNILFNKTTGADTTEVLQDRYVTSYETLEIEYTNEYENKLIESLPEEFRTSYSLQYDEDINYYTITVSSGTTAGEILTKLGDEYTRKMLTTYNQDSGKNERITDNASTVKVANESEIYLKFNSGYQLNIDIYVE